MFPDVDTRDAQAVAERVRHLCLTAFAEADLTFFDDVFDMVGAMFTGRFPGLAAVDISYHDYQHTLQATLCMAELLTSRQRHGGAPALSWRHVELGLAAVLLHDSGYLRATADGDGTGAKFTYAHVLRSCAMAATHLPRFGVRLDELPTAIGAIRCTGPDADMGNLRFRCDEDRIIGAALATADYLSQMAAVDYPDELEMLFNEFRESDTYANVPPAKRIFASAAELTAKTPAFWTHVVRPKLETDFFGIHRFLAEPYPHGPNRYLDAIERNMEIIAGRTPGATAVPTARAETA